MRPQVTGWFNLLGQWAVTAGIDFTLASFLSTIILCGTGGANGGGWVATQPQVGGSSLLQVLLIGGFWLAWPVCVVWLVAGGQLVAAGRHLG